MQRTLQFHSRRERLMVPVRIENRSQLIYLLTEAAELEHSILCCYLFAAFSMKDSTEEGLSTEQLELIQGWRREFGEIVVQEMVHLATACNLLTAVGGAPQLRRPNLPSSTRAYPPAFQLRLMPFGIDALEQFVVLERPESLAQGAEYRSSAQPLDRLSDIFSSERSYETVGELYRGIEDGLSYLAHKMGEDELFVGPASQQTAETFFDLPGLISVHDLDSALAAIQVIVEQGEGASLDVEDSHYRRFVRMRDECRAAMVEDPDFSPGRPALASPYAMLPGDVPSDAGVNLIDDPTTADTCNLFDGCYELMIQILGRLFVHAEESEAELATLADVAVSLMLEVLTPLGSAITRLPAGPSYPGQTAGPSFRLSRGASIPTHQAAAWHVFRERLLELARYCQFLQAEPGASPVLAPTREALERYAAMLGDS
jgi:hypothetical protein